MRNLRIFAQISASFFFVSFAQIVYVFFMTIPFDHYSFVTFVCVHASYMLICYLHASRRIVLFSYFLFRCYLDR